MTPTIVSIAVQVRKVSLILIPKYSLNIQKPVSFTWEHIKLPAPIESTISSGLTPELMTKGCTIPAAVKPATVAEPNAMRIIVALANLRIMAKA